MYTSIGPPYLLALAAFVVTRDLLLLGRRQNGALNVWGNDYVGKNRMAHRLRGGGCSSGLAGAFGGSGVAELR